MTNLIVLGMHRSGTSALAGALSNCGYYLGPNLLPAVPGFNDSGFFESQTVVDIHDEFFRSVGVDWRFCYRLTEDCFNGEAAAVAKDKISRFLGEMKSHQPWCIKDPRLSVLLPLWASELGNDVKVVICVRDPAEVSASLLRRDGLDVKHSLLLWTYYHLCSERYSRDYTRSIVNYSDLIASPESEVSRVSAEMNLEILELTEGQLGVESRFQHVDGAGIPVPHFVSECHSLFKTAQRDLNELDQIWLRVVPMLRFTPDVRSLEETAAERLADLELARTHIENVQNNFREEREQLSGSIEDLQDRERKNFESITKSAEVIANLQEKDRKNLELLEKRTETIEFLKEKDRANAEALEDNQKSIKRLDTELLNYQHELDQLSSKVSKIEQEAIDAKEVELGLRTELDLIRQAYNEVITSEFWRLTLPLRKLVQLIRRDTLDVTGHKLPLAFKPAQDIQLEDGHYLVTGGSPRLELILDQATFPAGQLEIVIGAKLSSGFLALEIESSDGIRRDCDQKFTNKTRKKRIELVEPDVRLFLLPTDVAKFDIRSGSVQVLR